MRSLTPHGSSLAKHQRSRLSWHNSPPPSHRNHPLAMRYTALWRLSGRWYRVASDYDDPWHCPSADLQLHSGNSSDICPGWVWPMENRIRVEWKGHFNKILANKHNLRKFAVQIVLFKLANKVAGINHSVCPPPPPLINWIRLRDNQPPLLQPRLLWLWHNVTAITVNLCLIIVV